MPHTTSAVPMVAGLAYRERLAAVPEAFTATLVAEPEQPYNPSAVAVYAFDRKIGYVAPEVARFCYEQVSRAGRVTCEARRVTSGAGRATGIEARLDLTALLAP